MDIFLVNLSFFKSSRYNQSSYLSSLVYVSSSHRKNVFESYLVSNFVHSVFLFSFFIQFLLYFNFSFSYIYYKHKNHFNKEFHYIFLSERDKKKSGPANSYSPVLRKLNLVF
uniref:Uncharacterized protein n=1 Tax=Micrurus spixii TaxID=129469 RepID=A0A2D4MS40_9SAUR